jgi:hypothetical protein
MKEAGVGLEICRVDDGDIEVNVDVTFNAVLSYQKTWYKLRFTDKEFGHFQNCLKNGIKSWHGRSSLWQANKIFIQKQNHPNNYRNVRMYRRTFILGLHIVPTTLPQEIVRGIIEAKV